MNLVSIINRKSVLLKINFSLSQIKYLISCLFITIYSFNCAGQETRKTILNELNFSGNSSVVNDDSTDNRYGYGLGVFHHSKLSEMIDLVSGIEFNHMSQYKESFYDGGTALYSDVTFDFNVISLRCFPRAKFGKKTQFILEAGPQMDIGIFNYYKAKSGWFFHGTQPGMENELKQDIEYGFNLYGCVGAGVVFASEKSSLIFKTEYKFGIDKEYTDQTIRHRYIFFTIGLIKNKF